MKLPSATEVASTETSASVEVSTSVGSSRAGTGSVLDRGLISRNGRRLVDCISGVLRFGSELVGHDLGMETGLISGVVDSSLTTVGELNRVVSLHSASIRGLAVRVASLGVLRLVAELVWHGWSVVSSVVAASVATSVATTVATSVISSVSPSTEASRTTSESSGSIESPVTSSKASSETTRYVTGVRGSYQSGDDDSERDVSTLKYI